MLLSAGAGGIDVTVVDGGRGDRLIFAPELRRLLFRSVRSVQFCPVHFTSPSVVLFRGGRGLRRTCAQGKQLGPTATTAYGCVGPYRTLA